MEKKSSKKTKTTAIALAMTLILALGATAAYQTAMSDVVSNAFTGPIAIDVDETTGSEYVITPGETQDKDPTVYMKDEDGELITGIDTYAYVIIHEEDNTYGTDESIVNWEIADGWTELNGYPADSDFTLDPTGLNVTVKAGDKVYYREVAASAAADAKFAVFKNNKVSYAADITSADLAGKNTKIEIWAYAIQKDPFNDPVKAWNQETEDTPVAGMPEKGNIIKIGEKEYRVLSINNNKAFVMSMYDVSNSGSGMAYDGDGTTSEKNLLQYKDSDIDYYLEDTWYAGLDNTMKGAIEATTIDQPAYEWTDTQPGSGTYYSGTYGFSSPSNYYIVPKSDKTATVGERHAYLLDVKDVVDYLGTGNLTPAKVNQMFFGADTTQDGKYCWLRSANTLSDCSAWCVDGNNGYLDNFGYGNTFEARAAFTIDLSQVAFTINE